MCTNPLKTVKDIDGAIEKLIKTNADSVIGMSKLDDNHPARAKRIVNDKIVDFCVPELSSRRQDLKPDAFIRNGSIYAIKRDVLILDKIRFGSENSRPYIMSYEKSVNIDNKIDLMVAEALLKERLMNEENNPEILVITPIKHIPGVIEILNSVGNITFIDDPSLDDVIKIISNFDAIFTNPNKSKVFIGKELIDAGTKLSVICTASTGTNHIDKKYCKVKNIKVISLTEERKIINKISSTAEHAFALMLSSLRKIPQSFDSVKSFNWDYEPFIGRQLDHLTIGVIGYGRLGTYFSRYARAFGCTILVNDPYKKIEEEGEIKQVDIDNLLSESDVISIHVHVTNETIGMIDENHFMKMKSNVLIINTARGDIVNENDLIKFLSVNENARYATDVLANEVIDNKIDNKIINYAKKSNQILITSHVAGMTVEGQSIAFNHAAKLLKDFFL